MCNYKTVFLLGASKADMELFIRGDAEFNRLYNCSFYNVSDISLEKRSNVPIGIIIFTVSFIEEAMI